MKIIVSVDNNFAIGKNNDLLVKIPADMKRFRDFTIGNVIIMGQKTLQSFPNKMPLKDRINIVFTKNPNLYKKYKKEENLIFVMNIEELYEKLKNYPDKEVFVVGGESIYKLLLPMCDEALVTKVDYSYDADRYFPNLDNNSDWEIVSTSEEMTYYDIIYRYVTYRKKR